MYYEQNNKKLKHDEININKTIKLIKFISRFHFPKAIN